ncbi:MAG: carbon-nitrogen hydrolase family protein [Pseudomonadota bacterium]
MRIAIWQSEPVPADTAQGLSRLAEGVAAAAAEGADLVIAPEMALTGYMIGPEACDRLAEPRGGRFHAAVAEMARAHGIAICFGYPEKGEAGTSNTAALIGPDGSQIADYRKSHLLSDIDRSQFVAGDALSGIHDLGGWKVALAICYDIEFPEVARSLRLAGAELVLVPTAVVLPYISAPKRIVPARAEENAFVIACANYAGEENGEPYGGHSCIVGPDGEDLARAGTVPSLIVADIDRAAIGRAEANVPYLADRRPELYFG